MRVSECAKSRLYWCKSFLDHNSLWSVQCVPCTALFLNQLETNKSCTLACINTSRSEGLYCRVVDTA
jgi:hypothetical protein